MEPKVKMKPEVQIAKPDVEVFEPGELGVALELLVKDKDGKVTERRTMKSRSFVRQFLDMLLVQAGQVGQRRPLQARDTGNTLREIYSTHLTFATDGPIGNTDFGIIVGTGTTAPIIDDHAIETLIDHDASPPTAGRVQYSAVTFGAPTNDATTSHFTVTRDFSNSSGGAITVNEIALYVKAYDWDGTTRYFMIIRDVIGGGIAVPNGQTLTVNYREQATV